MALRDARSGVGIRNGCSSFLIRAKCKKAHPLSRMGFCLTSVVNYEGRPLSRNWSTLFMY